MKSLEKKWSILLSSDSDNRLIDATFDKQNLNCSDLFDISADMFFANRYPSFNQLDCDQNNFNGIKGTNEIEALYSNDSDRNLEIEKFNENIIIIDKEELQHEPDEVKIDSVKEEIKEAKI